MKKILLYLLLLCSISTFAQAEFPEGIQLSGNASTANSSKLLNQNPTTGTLDHINATSLPVSTATANALDLRTENSSGAIQGFAITNNGNGTVNIATGTAYLRTTNDPYAPLIKYVIPSVTNLALTDNANNFVLVDYNGGSPALTVSISEGAINTTTNSIAYVISRVGNTLDYISLVGQNVDSNGKLRRRFLNSEGLRRAQGAVLTGSNRNLLITAGLFYSGLIEVPTPAFNTSTVSTFTQAYNNSGWVRTTGNTQINNTQYSLAGTLTTMPTNDYRVDYAYILADNPSKLYVLLGTTTYANINDARLAPVPTALPSELQVLGTRVGRIIIKKDATTMEVSSEYATIYQAGSATLHNDLGGLNLGDFQHLTVAEKANLELKTNKQNSLAIDGTGIKYPTVDAVNVNLVNKLDTEGARLDNALAPIYAWGDSLTEGLTVTPYTDQLQSIFGYTVTNKGVGGETSTQIKNRLVADTGNYSKSVIIWAGRNNFSDPTTVKADIATMISTIGHTRYLVVGILNSSNGPIGTTQYDQITALNTDLKAIYGKKYVAVREEIVSKYNPSIPQDVIDHNNDVPPTSLRITGDPLHLNTAGYKIVAEFINQRLGELFGTTGYFQSKDFKYYFDSLLPLHSVGDETFTGIKSATNTVVGMDNGIYLINNGPGGSRSLRIDNTLGGDGAYFNNKSTSTGAGFSTVNSSSSGGSAAVFLQNSASGRGLSGENYGTGIFAFINSQTSSTGDLIQLRKSGTTTTRFDQNGLLIISNASTSGSTVTANIVSGTGFNYQGQNNGVNTFTVDKTGSIIGSNYTGGANLTGTPTAPTATAGANTTQIATTAFVQGIRPYKIYTALLTQIGTSAPTAIVLENTLGGTVLWSYVSTGQYNATLTGAFATNKTAILPFETTSNVGKGNSTQLDNNIIRFTTVDITGSSINTVISSEYIEIRVYN